MTKSNEAEAAFSSWIVAIDIIAEEEGIKGNLFTFVRTFHMPFFLPCARCVKLCYERIIGDHMSEILMHLRSVLGTQFMAIVPSHIFESWTHFRFRVTVYYFTSDSTRSQRSLVFYNIGFIFTLADNNEPLLLQLMSKRKFEFWRQKWVIFGR